MTMATVQSALPEPEERVDTRRNIKVAARRLFAEHGLEAVTVREIVAAAGAKNGGSLNYYFKSKAGLVEELINELFNELSAAWLERLSELDKQGGPSSVREIVDIVVRGARPEAFTDPSPTSSRFLASVLFVRRKEFADYLNQMNFLVYRRLMQIIMRLRPDIPRQVMRQRLVFFSWYVVAVQSAYETWRASRRRSDLWADPDPLVHLVDTATAMLESGVMPPAPPLSPFPPAEPAKPRAGAGRKASAKAS